MHYLTRILTSKIPHWMLGSPQGLLGAGSGIYTNEDKVRVFFLRKVAYDDSMTPLWTIPEIIDEYFADIESLHRANPRQSDTTILDYDNKLQIWNEEQ